MLIKIKQEIQDEPPGIQQRSGLENRSITESNLQSQDQNVQNPDEILDRFSDLMQIQEELVKIELL